MILRGIDFGHVFMASGSLNFFGQGYWYDKYLKFLFGLDASSATFISKTTTLYANEGYLPFDKNLQPTEFFPDCIRIYPFKKIVLNAVGLSGPGAVSLFNIWKWQFRERPFLLSFAALGKTEQLRLWQTNKFVDTVTYYLPFFKTKIGLELNIACPNTDYYFLMPTSEITRHLSALSRLNIPILAKINIMTTPETVMALEKSGLADAISCSNTIPWGKLPDKIDWKKLFGTDISPLSRYGGGGLSGEPLLGLVRDWLSEVRNAGIKIPIKAGGGILKTADIDALVNVGADTIELGTVKILRPWRVKKLITYANHRFNAKNKKS